MKADHEMVEAALHAYHEETGEWVSSVGMGAAIDAAFYNLESAVSRIFEQCTLDNIVILRGESEPPKRQWHRIETQSVSLGCDVAPHARNEMIPLPYLFAAAALAFAGIATALLRFEEWRVRVASGEWIVKMSEGRWPRVPMALMQRACAEQRRSHDLTSWFWIQSVLARLPLHGRLLKPS